MSTVGDFFSGLFGGDSEEEEENEEKKPAGKYTDPCLLIDYIKEFGSLSKNRQNPDGWDNFKVVETSLNSTPADIISSMTSRGGLQEFLEMDNTTLGLLVPKVRLFKQYYKDENDVIGTSLEYLFDDSFDSDRIEAMTRNGMGRSGGAGIKEVSWEFNGTNPAEAERVISVSMKFLFQSAYDLLGNRYDPQYGNILAVDPEADLNLEDEKYTKNYIDLILHPPSKTEAFGGKARKDELGNNYVPKFYRLKMIVGWAVPEGNFPSLSEQPSKVYKDGEAPKSRNEKLKEELRAMEQSVFLNLVSHQFDMKENGQIELTVDYVGSFEETINGNSANVLKVSNAADEATKKKLFGYDVSSNNAEFNVEKDKRFISDLKKKIDCLDLSSDAGKEQQKKIEEEIKDAETRIKGNEDLVEEFDDNSKSIIYKQFLEGLAKRVRTFTLTEESALSWVESLSSSIRPDFSNIVKQIAPPTTGAGIPNVVADATDLSDTEGFWVDTSQEEQVEEAIEKIKENLENTSVAYLLFGDILNQACGLANSFFNREADSNMKILTGPVMLTHPRSGEKIQMNLADIPISYDDFQLFFFETVVRKELASYPLRTFIKDVMERLIKKVLQPRDCFASGREQRQVDIGMTNFTIRSSVAKQMNLDNTSMKTGGRFRLDPSTFNNLNPSPATPDEEYNCILLYMTSFASYDLVGDEIEDRKKGIYHYYIGAERGLIQKIEFSRSDVQGLREARQSESRNLGQIRDVYNANVRMIGNTLYIPGMKVFLNPPIGFGRPEVGSRKADEASGTQGMYGSLANILGIGGYYDVIKVQSTISRGSVFSTELDCVFAQSGGESEKLRELCSGIPDKARDSEIDGD